MCFPHLLRPSPHPKWHPSSAPSPKMSGSRAEISLTSSPADVEWASGGVPSLFSGEKSGEIRAISRLFLKGGKSVSVGSVGLLTCAQIGKGGREDFSAPVALFHPLSFGLVSLRREKEGRKEGRKGGLSLFHPFSSSSTTQTLFLCAEFARSKPRRYLKFEIWL